MSLKLYAPSSRKSKIPDEIIDERIWNDKQPRHTIQIESLDDNFKFDASLSYKLRFFKKNELKAELPTIKQTKSDLLEISIDKDTEKKLQTGNTKDPFKAELYDTNASIVLEASFYRFKSKKMSGKSQTFPIPSKPPTQSFPEESDSDLSQSFDTSSLKSSSIAQRFDLYKKRGFVKKKMSQQSDICLDLIEKNDYLNDLTDDGLTNDDFDSDYKNETVSTFKIDNESNEIEFKLLRHQEMNTSFSSIESVTKSNLFDDFDMQLEKLDNIEKKFYSFGLKVTDFPSQNYKNLRENIYLIKSDKIFVSNHAIRCLVTQHDINYIASFKLEIKIGNRTRSGQVRHKFENDLIDLLLTGIECSLNSNTKKIKFYYIGHSNSGLREKNFWAIDGHSFMRLNFESFIKNMGNFTKFISIQKLSKRLSQFYSASKQSIVLNRGEYVLIDDEHSSCRKYVITDGIGLIRLSACDTISEILGLDFKTFVFQIRCGGFKGILAGMPDHIFDLELHKHKIPSSKSIKCIFRKSQSKFDSNESQLSLNIVSWTSYTQPPASLNSEFLMVLDGLTKGSSFKREMISMYKSNLKDIEDSLIDPKKAFSKLFQSPEINEFTVKYASILLACRQDIRAELDPQQYKIIKELIIEQNIYNVITKRKFNIQIEKSRYLIGILDESGCLKENEVFVSYRDSLGNVNYLNNVSCIIGRTPCYSLNEMRIVTTRDVPELRHLVNCVAFPKTKQRPLTNILSGGDLDGDLYFVSWDEIFSSIKNFTNIIDYPKSDDIINLDNSNCLREKLVKHYVNSCITEDNTGLWHYYMTCLYDQDRENMKSKSYLEAVIEINKAIDGVASLTRVPGAQRKPCWYISGDDLNSVESEKKKEDKFKNLSDLLVKKKFNFDLVESNFEDYSLLSCLAHLTIQKFIQIVSNSSKISNGRFLTEDDINLLVKDKIIGLDVSNSFVIEENNRIITTKFHEYINKISMLDKGWCGSKGKKGLRLFAGMVERKEMSRHVSKLDEEKTRLTEDFRNLVNGLKFYEDEDNYNEHLKNSFHSPTGYYTNSRIIDLYLSMRQMDCYYQIPWIFYDVLCFLKNYCNCKRDPKLSKIVPNSLPFTMSYEYLKAFSVTKLLNLNQFY